MNFNDILNQHMFLDDSQNLTDRIISPNIKKIDKIKIYIIQKWIIKILEISSNLVETHITNYLSETCNKDLYELELIKIKIEKLNKSIYQQLEYTHMTWIEYMIKYYDEWFLNNQKSVLDWVNFFYTSYMENLDMNTQKELFVKIHKIIYDKTITNPEKRNQLEQFGFNNLLKFSIKNFPNINYENFSLEDITHIIIPFSNEEQEAYNKLLELKNILDNYINDVSNCDEIIYEDINTKNEFKQLLDETNNMIKSIRHFIL